MAARKRNAILSTAEIRHPFEGDWGERFPPILSPAGLAKLLGLSPKTVYEWISKGRLDGAFRKRGKHVLLWRDKALDLIFNGPEWN